MTVTPLFIAGADPRGAPELRVPSVRGALRFWLRALAGGCYGTDDAGLQEVRKLEAKVFGDAGGKDGFGASKVVVTLDGSSVEPQEWRPIRQSRERRGDREPGAGINYLYWSMGRQRVRGEELPAKQCFPPDSRFTLTLTARHGVEPSLAREGLYHAVRATWLLVHLGGLGARARRTAGSLAAELALRRDQDGTVRRVRVRHLDLPFQLSSTPADAARELGEGLSLVRRRLSDGRNVNRQRPAFEVLDPNWCRIWVFGGWKGHDAWMTAADVAGLWLRESRRQLPTDQRLVFGMPLVIPQQHARIEPPQAYAKAERRSSPLWLTLTRAVDGSLLGVATLFLSRLLDVRQPVPDDHQLERHFDWMARRLAELPNAVEVRYE
jgi:CRISPR-associated protein Cmr1